MLTRPEQSRLVEVVRVNWVITKAPVFRDQCLPLQLGRSEKSQIVHVVIAPMMVMLVFCLRSLESMTGPETE